MVCGFLHCIQPLPAPAKKDSSDVGVPVEFECNYIWNGILQFWSWGLTGCAGFSTSPALTHLIQPIGQESEYSGWERECLSLPFIAVWVWPSSPSVRVGCWLWWDWSGAWESYSSGPSGFSFEPVGTSLPVWCTCNTISQTQTHMHAQVYTYACPYTHSHIYTREHTYTRIHSQVYTCAHACMHTDTHLHVHTHTVTGAFLMP